MKKKWGNGSQKNERRFIFKSIAGSAAAGGISIMLLLFTFAVIYANYDLPLGLVQPFAIIALLVGCLLCGFICSRIINHQGMRWGGICSFVLFLCLFTAALIFCEQPLGAMVLSKCAMMTTSGMIGGVFGVNFRR